IYSLGIGNDISFDEEIQAFNNYSCRIYGYNKRVIQKDLRARYKEINGEFAALQIAPVTQKHKNNYALNDLVKFNKDETVEFLKMDIEQSEHDTLMPFLEEYRVCQLFVEIHGEAQKHTSLLQRIASLDYALFSFEPNPYCKYCCEYSFIHLDCMQRYGASVSKLYLKDIVPALN
ncbi:unnamed protein product, partial [Heligmosomoides polygyrus]|uniref:Methyltransf_21 domain-containing protein n=1 Tax=Heligmosomoides polygyrus TaxID=6339 RepID=A0A183F5Q7_HELPZ